MSTLKTTNLQNASSSSTNLALDTSGNATSAGTVVMSSPYTMRNKIINGAIVIDQRNAGASTSVGTASAAYTLDRWRVYHDTAITSNITAQQSSTVPSTGFINSQILTNGTGTSPAAGDFNVIQQRIEGFNIADLNYGSSTAATTTLSFWVRSSLTGTFGFGVTNSNQDRSVVYTYTISSANTWEQKTITIAGDQSGTWLTTNGIGLILSWDLGSGTSSNAAATGTWYGARYVRTSACTNFIGTTGATFYITGVQLERGTVATPFEYRNYQQELAMCQRYFQKSYDIETAVGTASYNGYLNWNWQNLSNYGTANIILPVRMRAAPTCTNYNPALTNTVGGRYWNGSAEVAFTGSMNGWDQYQSTIRFNKDATNSTNILIQWTASAEL